MDITISKMILEGCPISKARHRMSRGKAYDPQKIEKERTQWCIKEQWDAEPVSAAIDVALVFLMPYPKSWSKKKKETFSQIPHTVKPDIDNLCKFYLDCMNSIVYEDDKQIVGLVATKLYCDHEGETHIEIIQDI